MLCSRRKMLLLAFLSSVIPIYPLFPQVPPEEVLPSVVRPAEVLQSEAEELPLPSASPSAPTLQDTSTRR